MPDVADETGASRFNVLGRGAAARFLGIARVDGDGDSTFSRRKLAEILGLDPQPPVRQSRRSALRAVNLAHNTRGPRDLAFRSAGELGWLAPAWQVPTRYRVEVERDGRETVSAMVGTLGHLAHEQPESERMYADPDHDAGVAARYTVCAVSKAGDALCASLIGPGAAAWDFETVQPAITRGVDAGAAPEWDFAASGPAVTRGRGLLPGAADWRFETTAPAVTRTVFETAALWNFATVEPGATSLGVRIDNPLDSLSETSTHIFRATVGGTATGPATIAWSVVEGGGLITPAGVYSPPVSITQEVTVTVRVTVERGGLTAHAEDTFIVTNETRVSAGDAAWSFAAATPTVTRGAVTRVAADTGDAAWDFAATQAAVTRVAAPTTPTISASVTGPGSADTGDTATYRASVGGTAAGAISYQWQRRSGTSGAWSNVGTSTSSYSFRTLNAGTWQVRVVVTRQGVSATSGAVTTVWSVPGPPETLTVSISGPSAADIGDTATYTANVGGTATGPITYEWQARSSNTNWGIVGDGATYSETQTTAGTRRVRLRVSRGSLGLHSNIVDTVWSEPAPQPLTLTIGNTTIVEFFDSETGALTSAIATVRATASGGSGGYVYEGTGTHQYTTGGTKTVTVTVTDSDGNTATGTATFTIHSQNPHNP